MSVTGVVLGVSPDWRGSDLTVATTTGTTVLSVVDAVDFDEDGGWLVIADETTPRQYVAVDFDADTVTLAAAVGAVFEEHLFVSIWDATTTGGSRVVEYVAQVLLDGNAGPMDATVPHELVPAADVDLLVGATVAVEESAGDDSETPEWAVAAVIGREASIDGSHVADGSMPSTAILDPENLGGDSGPDGLAPASSPTPTVIGGIGILHVRWAPVDNHDPVTYEVHLSATSGFTPAPATLAAESSGGAAALTRLPDGTPLAYGTTYYVKVVAKDVDGPAVASAEASGSMFQVTGPDVSAEYVYAGTLNYGQLLGGPIDASGLVAATIKTSASGARVEMDSTGVTVKDSAGAPVTELKGTGSTFRGQVTATDLTTTGSVRFTGDDIEVGVGAEVTLADSYKAPSQAPTWAASHTTLTVPEQEYRGLASLDATYWAAVRTLAGGGYALEKINKSTAAVSTVTSTVSTTTVLAGVFVAAGTPWIVTTRPSSVICTGFDATTGAFQGSHTVVLSDIPGVPTAAEAEAAAYGYDAANARVLMAWVDGSANAVKVSRWDLAGGNITTLTTDFGNMNDLSGIVYRASEFGSAAYAIRGDATTRVFNASTGAQMSGSNWTDDSGALGFTHDGANFHALYPASIIKYEADAGVTGWWVSSEWYDSVGSTHRTGLGKAVKINPPRRAKVTLATSAGIPGAGGADEPNQARFYVARSDSSTQPAATAFWMQGAASVPGRTAETVVTPATSGTAGTTTNEFLSAPSTAPGLVKSAGGGATPHTELRGNGYARLAKLIQSGSIITGSIAAGTAWQSVGSVAFAASFDAAPNVVFQNHTGWSGSDPISFRAVSLTATGFTLEAKCGTARTGQTVHWIATTAS